MGEFEKVPIQKVEDYWNARPCNIRHSAKEIGTKEYFDEVEKRKYFVESHIPGFAEFSAWKGKKVLEIGCGIGMDTINFARAGAAVSAIDLSCKSLEVARKRATVFGLEKQIRFFEGNSEDLDSIVPVEPYDLIYSFGVIHHTPHPEKVIQQIKRYMNPGSELRIMVYSRISYKLFWIMKEENLWDFGRIDEIIARNSEAQTGCPVTYSYSFDGLKRLLTGFEILDLKKAHIFTWDLEAYKRGEYKKDKSWSNVSDNELAEFEKELGWHTLCKAKIS